MPVEGARAYLDTSALAKLYLREPGSDAFEEYFWGLGSRVISSLNRVEMRSVLARLQRTDHLDEAGARRIHGAFLRDIASRSLEVMSLNDATFDIVGDLVARTATGSLGTLDAIHLAAAESMAVEEIATADRVMADAAEAIGIRVVRFD